MMYADTAFHAFCLCSFLFMRFQFLTMHFILKIAITFIFFLLKGHGTTDSAVSDNLQLECFRRMKGTSIASQDFKPVCDVKMIILRCIDKESGPAAAHGLRIPS